MHDSFQLNNDFGKMSNISENFDHKLNVFIRFESQILVAD